MSTTPTLTKKTDISVKKSSGINFQALEEVGRKFDIINSYIQKGEDIPRYLTKDFVHITLSDDPYSDIE